MQIPENFKELLTAKKAFAHVATVMPDGSPQVTPIWCDFDGNHILLNSSRGRVKDKNMRRDARVAVSVQDPDNAYRYIQIRGKVVEVTEKGAEELWMATWRATLRAASRKARANAVVTPSVSTVRTSSARGMAKPERLAWYRMCLLLLSDF